MADAGSAEEYSNLSVVDHIKKKGMWAGAVTRTLIPDLYGVYAVDTPVATDEPPTVPRRTLSVEPIRRDHTPALLKSWDELVVNASDHVKACAASKSRREHSKVTYIAVTFEPERGVFTVENDGPGIPAELHAGATAAAGRDVYVPEMAFCVPFSGTNMEKSDDNVKGGINGIGAKIANIHSKLFLVDTVSFAARTRTRYRQYCHDGMTRIDPPEVAPAGDGDTPRTLVKMLPDYAALGYGTPGAARQWKEDYADLLRWLHLRCCQLAAYVGAGVRVTLNGRAAHTDSAHKLAALYVEAPLIAAARPVACKGGVVSYLTTKAAAAKPTYAEMRRRAEFIPGQLKAKEPPFKNHPWDVVAVVVPQLRKFHQISIINGVVTAGGSHVTYIKEFIKDVAVKKLRSASKDKDVAATTSEATKHMLLVAVGALPRADWTGQRKDQLDVPRAVLKNYAFAPAWLSRVGAALSEAMLDASGTKRTARVKVEKYQPAKTAGSKAGGPTASLIVTEGDSASTLVRSGLTLGERANPGGPSFRTHGLFSLGGVPMNAAKQVTSRCGLDDAVQLIRSKKLTDNKTFASLEQVLGLDHALTYDSRADRDRLRYGHIIAAVDQDVDGAGKILGLLLMYFNVFWPALIEHGYVQWFMTPIVRVYPPRASTERLRAKAGPMREFYHERAFHDWLAEDEDRAARATVRYFKGLGGHERHEVPLMFRDFDSRLYRFRRDEDAARLFEVYFGCDTAPRKAELSTPLLEAAPGQLADIDSSRDVPCSFQLRQYAKAYKLDAMSRQLPGLLDGFTDGRRKAFAGARKRFARGGECKTFQLTGYVTDNMLYHHAGESMNNTLVKMCQTFPGARAVPLILGSGEFGTRLGGGKDFASPRYTSVSLNAPLADALLPPDDDWLLPYEFVDGVRAQPRSYVPVLPLAVLDCMEIPSEGWSYLCWGRRPSQVADIVRAFCATPSTEDFYSVAVTHLAAGVAVDVDAVERAVLAGDVAGGDAERLARLREVAAAPNARARAFAEMARRFPLDVSLRGLRGRVGLRRGRLHHFGEYRVVTRPGDPDGLLGSAVVVTELPLRKWTDKFVEGLTETVKAGSKPPAYAKYIDDVENLSNCDNVHVTVKLKPGALLEIRESFGRAAGEGVAEDPIVECFGLYNSLRSSLNVMRPPPDGDAADGAALYGGVLECGENYHVIVVYWLAERRRLYLRRVERRTTVLELNIRLEEETIRYIDLAGSGAVAVSKIDDEAEACRVLAAHRFPRIHVGLLRQPRYSKAAHLRASVVVDAGDARDAGAADDDAGEADEADEADDAKAAVAGRASYSYILNLRERDLLGSARKKREKVLAKHRAELEECSSLMAEKPFPAASLWLKELDSVERIMSKDGFWF